MNKKIANIMVSSFLLLSPLGVYQEAKAENLVTLKGPQQVSLDENWILNTTFASHSPSGMIQANGEYIVVGPYGTIMKSKDGINWKTYSQLTNLHFNAIGFNGQKYVAIGAEADISSDSQTKKSEVFVSSDSITWKKLDFKFEEHIQGMESDGKKFIAVGFENIYISYDGENWTKEPSPANVTDYWGGILYINGTFFIGTYDGTHLLTSKDGEHWSYKHNPSVEISSIIWSGKEYLAVGNGLFTSKDGLNWTKKSTIPAGRYDDVAYNGKTFIITGRTNQDKRIILTSADGEKWKTNNMPVFPKDVNLSGIMPTKDGFITLSSYDWIQLSNSYSMFSKDGVNWSYKLLGISSELNGVATNGKRAVAVGENGNVVYTDDGTNWKSSYPLLSNPVLFDVAWDGKKFVASGNIGIFYSPDGVAWKQSSIRNFDRQYGLLTKIIWTGKFFVATGQTNAGAYFSKDGISWTGINSPTISKSWLQTMVWDGKRLLGVVETYNEKLKSKHSYKIVQTIDGQKWTDVYNMPDGSGSGFLIAYNGKQYIVKDEYGTNKVFISKDGLHWSQQNTNLDDIDSDFLTSIDGQFVSFNYEGKYYLSADGQTWNEFVIPNNSVVFDSISMLDGVKFNGKYIFVGRSGKILVAKKLGVIPVEKKIAITVEGSLLEIPKELGKAFIENGTTFIPLRVIGEHLGYEVSWDGENQKVILTDKNSEGSSVEFSGGIKLIENRSYVPLRSLSEKLGYKVNYKLEDNTHHISIEK